MSDFFRTWMFYALTGPELKASDNIRQDFGGIELTDDGHRLMPVPIGNIHDWNPYLTEHGFYD